MFLKGFLKTAATMVTMTPEEYFEVVREKDPFVGATIGALAGAGHGLWKGKKNNKAQAALIRAALGGSAGAVGGHLGGKVLRHYQANKVHRMADELNLRATPHRR